MNMNQRIRTWKCECIGTACEMSSKDDAVPRIRPCGFIPHWREVPE